MKKSKLLKIAPLIASTVLAVPVVAVSCSDKKDNKKTPLTVDDWDAKVKCGDVTCYFYCYSDGTAQLVDADNDDGILIVPATVYDSWRNITCRVTTIRNLPSRGSVDGIKFKNAYFLRRIEDYAFKDWKFEGCHCDLDFTNTQLEYVGVQAFTNCIYYNYSDIYSPENLVQSIRFPKTIRTISDYAFSTPNTHDYHCICVGRIDFLTDNEEDIKKITFGKKWTTKRVDTDDTVHDEYLQYETIANVPAGCANLYKNLPNFIYEDKEKYITWYSIDYINEKESLGYLDGRVSCLCKDVWCDFDCYSDGTAVLMECGNNHGTLEVPATVKYNNREYKVTDIQSVRTNNTVKKVDGISFRKATNLKYIWQYAFYGFSFEGKTTDMELSYTKLEIIGCCAFGNVMNSNNGEYAMNDGYMKFPETVKWFGNGAFHAWVPKKFDYPMQFKNVYFTQSDPDKIAQIYFHKFWGTLSSISSSSGCTFHIPTEAALEAYKARENFNYYDCKLVVGS